jgi:hypothetical protein
MAQVKGDDHLSINGKQATSVGASRSLSVGGDVVEIFNSNHNEKTTGINYLKARGVVIEASTGITLKCGGSNVVIDPAGVTLKGALVTLDGGMVKIGSGPGSPPAVGVKRPAAKPAAPGSAIDADIADPSKVAKAKVAKAHELEEIPFTHAAFNAPTGNMGIGTPAPPAWSKPPNPSCAKKRGGDDKLSQEVETTYQEVMNNPNAKPECIKRSQDVMSDRERFNSYREALPYAQAASDLNELGDGDDDKKKQLKREKACVSMLPVDDADKLNAELGLPKGTITDEMLRNDKTGFRAALFRDESTGKLILAGRDTQPNSLVDWQTNTRNGQGLDTPQYKAMRDLAKILKKKKVECDLSGYSKGGGLAQEAGLISKKSKVYVFNSAGLHEKSLARTGGHKSFDKLESRTKSFSSEGEFLTFMNDTTDTKQQVANAKFLRDELKGDGWFEAYPMKVKYRNPEMKAKLDKKGWFDSDPDPDFAQDKADYIKELDGMIVQYEEKLKKGEDFRIFPPIHSGSHQTVVGSGDYIPGLGTKNPNIAKMAQHLMSRVLGPMKKSVDRDRLSLDKFVSMCGSP